MSEIDWSKAPEGAQYYCVDNRLFYKFDGAGRGMCTNQRGPWFPCGDINDYEDGELIPRPSTPAWNGEGLPPVGTHIEWFSPIYGWLGGRVVGHDGSVTVVVHNDGYTGCHPHEVRPIRTPEQIAAEEREKAVQKMLAAAGVTGSAFADDPEAAVWAAALYDAGYRKVEP